MTIKPGDYVRLKTLSDIYGHLIGLIKENEEGLYIAWSDGINSCASKSTNLSDEFFVLSDVAEYFKAKLCV